MVERTQHTVSLLFLEVLEVEGEACVEVYACLGVVPWGVMLVVGEVVAIGVRTFEVAVYSAIGFVLGVEEVVD